LNEEIGSKGQQRQCEHAFLHGYLPSASQHLGVKTRAMRTIVAIIQAR
jgi:hypothetical protein